jgi:hypothetical protein
VVRNTHFYHHPGESLPCSFHAFPPWSKNL